MASLTAVSKPMCGLGLHKKSLTSSSSTAHGFTAASLLLSALNELKLSPESIRGWLSLEIV